VSEALASIAGKYSHVYAYGSDGGAQWKHYVPDRDDVYNSLMLFKPGYGYWLQVTEACVLEGLY